MPTLSQPLSRPALKISAAVVGALSIAALLPVPVFAQDGSASESSAPNEFDQLKSCRTIQDDIRRLACFDSAMGVVIAAEENGDLRVVDREADQRSRRRLFGFSLPNLGLFGGGNDDEPLEELTTTITSVSRYSRSGWLFRTEEGATWQISSSPSRLRPPQTGQSVVFKQASMGSYFIRIDGQLGVKGKRVE